MPAIAATEAAVAEIVAAPARGRPRRVPDADIVLAALEIVLASGPASLTFARLGEHVALVPATLSHRFGTRDALIAEVSHAVTRRFETIADEACARPGGIGALVRFLVDLGQPGATPASVINQVSLMQIELATPGLRDDVARRSHAVRHALRSMLASAIVHGELGCASTRLAPDRLAAALHDTQVGAMLNWCVNPDGALRDRVRRDVRFVLAPFVVKPTQRGRTRRGAR